MPVPTFSGLPPFPGFEDVVEKINKLVNELRNLMLNLDDANFDHITANVMDVQQLSAITADLGTITAGIINSVQIFGSYIATANGTYPRAEMSSVDNFFRAANNANQYVAILPFEVLNTAPAIEFINTPTGSSADLYINPTNGRFNIASPNSIRVSTGTGSFLIDANNIFVSGSQGITGTVYVSSTSGGPATTAITFTNGIRTS